MRLLRNILALTPCGKPQASHFAHVTGLLQWLPGRVNFTTLEHYGGRSARTHARWFARPFPFARLGVASLGAVHPRDRWELLALDASFVAKSGDQTWARAGFGAAWPAPPAGAWRLRCWRRWTWRRAAPIPSVPGNPRAPSGRAGRRAGPTPVGRRPRCGPGPAGRGSRGRGPETLGARWVAVDGGYARRPFVEGVRQLDLHTVGRLRKDAVLRFPYLGSHERRPGRKRQFDGCFDRRDPARMTRTTLQKEKVDLYHGHLHAKAWQCWLQVVYVLPRGADPETKEGVLLYSTDLDLAPERIFRFYGARFQIEFAFRDAKQHLGLNDGQARSQARQHFHFNIVFAALFWARLQARLRAERPLGPFSLRDCKRCHLEEEIHKRFAARSAAGRNAPNSEAGRRRVPPNASGCAHPLPKRGRSAPEHNPWTGTAHRLRPQILSKP